MSRAGRPARPPRYPRRRRRLGVLVAVLVIGVLGYVLLGDGRFWSTVSSADTSASEPARAAPVDVTFAELLDDAAVNADGSVTVTASEAQVGGLVRDGLDTAGGPTLTDVTVDVQAPAGAADGQLAVRGTLDEQRVPVTAIVDLTIVDGQVAPVVRDARVGPLPVPAAVRDDLTRQLSAAGVLSSSGIRLEDLRTTDGDLVVTGRRG